MVARAGVESIEVRACLRDALHVFASLIVAAFLSLTFEPCETTRTVVEAMVVARMMHSVPRSVNVLRLTLYSLVQRLPKMRNISLMCLALQRRISFHILRMMKYAWKASWIIGA